MMIHLSTLPRLRYVTAGDYFRSEDGIQHIIAMKQRKKDYEFLILVHELIEWYLTERNGIAERDIMAFDLKCEADEPGAQHDAPYHKEHMQAELIERMLAEMMGIDWTIYEQEIQVSE